MDTNAPSLGRLFDDAEALISIEGDGQLVPTEREELERLEGVVERGLETFVEVGMALGQIRDRKLYREGHPSFDTYCRQRWGLTRQRAYQLMGAAAVVANVSTIVDIPMPANEAQARELARLKEPEQQRAAWLRVVEGGDGGTITAAKVEQEVRDLLGDNQAAQTFTQDTETPEIPEADVDEGCGEWDEAEDAQEWSPATVEEARSHALGFVRKYGQWRRRVREMSDACSEANRAERRAWEQLEEAKQSSKPKEEVRDIRKSYNEAERARKDAEKLLRAVWSAKPEDWELEETAEWLVGLEESQA
jgi:hypothetical protein